MSRFRLQPSRFQRERTAAESLRDALAEDLTRIQGALQDLARRVGNAEAAVGAHLASAPDGRGLWGRLRWLVLGR